MADPQNGPIGDGQDNFAGAASNAAKAAQQAGKPSRKSSRNERC